MNDFLSLFDITALWLSNETLAKITVIIVETWQWTSYVFAVIGWLTVPTPRTLFAAAIDGVSQLKICPCHLPNGPHFIGAILIRLIEASKIMDTIYVLTSDHDSHRNLKFLYFQGDYANSKWAIPLPCLLPILLS